MLSLRGYSAFMSRSRRVLMRENILKYSVHRKRFSTGKNDAGLLEKYEKKTPHEHVLLRPGMYIGQIEASPLDTWLLNEDTKVMQRKFVTFSPAFIKLFDEILVNAADNSQRDKNTTQIDIKVMRKKGKSARDSAKDGISIEIKNDGKGIPIQLHPKEKVYIPDLIFGHLLTGSNFDDLEGRLTGGRHGYGAKLTNIFSHQFSIETYDKKQQLLYKQTWKRNMFEVEPAVITSVVLPKDYTLVRFDPDMERFGFKYENGDKKTLDAASDAMLLTSQQLFRRRALDIAACLPNVKVTYNGDTIKSNSFVEYMKLFVPAGDHLGAELQDLSINDDGEDSSDESISDTAPKTKPYFHTIVNDRWEIGVIRSPSNAFESVSFVNSVWTAGGGSHVNYISSQILRAFEEVLSKKTSKTIPPALIRNKLMVFVKCSIENPSFDSQSKNVLTTKPINFGSECTLPKAFLKKLVKDSGIVEDVLIDMNALDTANLLRAASKSSKKSQFIDVPKLEDAHWAGGTKSLDCTLILTEGDSAKALAVAGLEVVGREKFGVLPLKGKILNARGASTKQLAKNEELMNVCKALGLDFSKSYNQGLQNSGLRYGRVLLMCDQDHDGSHIKGLVMNFFHVFWPELLLSEGFLQQFITPLVKVRPAGGIARNIEKSTLAFYSLPEYEAWRQAQGLGQRNILSDDSSSSSSSQRKYSIKYYKGLGTNTSEEGKSYFRALEQHRKLFYSDGTEKDAIDMVFNKSRAEDRRNWLTTKYNADDFVNPSDERVSYGQFIDKELIQFSASDNLRSLPSVIDGLKPSQRKVLFGCFSRNLTQDMKVVQVAGYVAEKTAYHHGEVSLHSTIIRMAQDYVGSNNLPYLVPSGQFGTRAQGGQDFASPRYIFTRLSPITRALFPEADDELLEAQEEDGIPVEPKVYLPILPAILINGSTGIGTGWSTSIPTYNPRDIAAQVKARIKNNGEYSGKPLRPWVRGFRGKIVKVPGEVDSFLAKGVVNRVGKNKLEVTELPIGTWTDDYKQFLIKLVEEGQIRGFSEYHTSTEVKFAISAPSQWIDDIEAEGFKPLRLDSRILLTNMHAYDCNGVIKPYFSPEEIIAEHFTVRRAAYERRKLLLCQKLAIDVALSRNRSRFIACILDGRIRLLGGKVAEDDVVSQLKALNFETLGEIQDKGKTSPSTPSSRMESNPYSYLLNMPIHSLTEARYQSLVKQAEESSAEYETMQATPADDLWVKDIDKFVRMLGSEY